MSIIHLPYLTVRLRVVGSDKSKKKSPPPFGSGDNPDGYFSFLLLGKGEETMNFIEVVHADDESAISHLVKDSGSHTDIA